MLDSVHVKNQGEQNEVDCKFYIELTLRPELRRGWPYMFASGVYLNFCEYLSIQRFRSLL